MKARVVVGVCVSGSVCLDVQFVNRKVNESVCALGGVSAGKKWRFT